MFDSNVSKKAVKYIWKGAQIANQVHFVGSYKDFKELERNIAMALVDEAIEIYRADDKEVTVWEQVKVYIVNFGSEMKEELNK